MYEEEKINSVIFLPLRCRSISIDWLEIFSIIRLLSTGSKLQASGGLDAAARFTQGLFLSRYQTCWMWVSALKRYFLYPPKIQLEITFTIVKTPVNKKYPAFSVWSRSKLHNSVEGECKEIILHCLIQIVFFCFFKASHFNTGWSRCRLKYNFYKIKKTNKRFTVF